MTQADIDAANRAGERWEETQDESDKQVYRWHLLMAYQSMNEELSEDWGLLKR
jgi:hypothetical protein